jgi:predicted short-subunit dehydrogenase-like oxidoreductase (DUF2520 family)
MKIIIIGSGNVATHFGKALYAAKFQISQVWSFHYDNAKQLANTINAEAINSLSEVDVAADVCILAVKDDVIAEVAARLTLFTGLIVHTSGAVGLDVFANDFDRYGVLYPLQTFSKVRDVNFTDIPLCIEAHNKNSLHELNNIAEKLSRDVREIDTEKRKILHLAAVFACNFTNHMYVLAEKILTDYSLDFDILRPLILETASKITQNSPLVVQTGPAIRNDEKTIAKHEILLAESPSCLKIYKTLSESIKKTR